MSAEGMKAMCWLAMYALAFGLAPLGAAAVDPHAAQPVPAQTQPQA
ncbi:hypothetical protein [Oceanicaulis sp.]|jgi:hypothetical protein|nr:hypothetical protein [Oceanicaulis sp.]|tara:strand:- start:406 stop:543 length:138 start_codon:yes stop_codon:yes gene_type:complete